MNPKTYKGWIVIGKRGKVIALMLDDPGGTLVNKDFTNAEARKTKEKVFRVELNLLPPK